MARNIVSKFLKELQNSEQKLQSLVSTNLLAITQQRIFNNTKGSKNSEDVELGFYSDAYKKKKLSKTKKQSLVNKVNLYDTGTLFESMKVVKDENETYIAVTSKGYVDNIETTDNVSRYIDTLYKGKTGSDVFSPSENEVKKVVEIAKNFIKKEAEKFNNEFKK